MLLIVAAVVVILTCSFIPSVKVLADTLLDDAVDFVTCFTCFNGYVEISEVCPIKKVESLASEGIGLTADVFCLTEKYFCISV